ncbi:MAG TPA: hypothetical protein VK615_13815 [Candidatus Binatia bacterium]|nr:hypothetical protein [Candidatus Binatia bacterium]
MIRVSVWTAWGTVLLAACSSGGEPQSPGERDQSFVPTVSGRVMSMASQHGGRIFVGGLSVNPVSKNGLVRIEEDGSMDVEFDPPLLPFTEDFGLGGMVRSLAVQPDGKILVGGRIRFRGAKATDQPLGLARLNFDGSVDAGFAAEVFPDVFALKLQPNRQILVGRFGSSDEPCLKRLNFDGSPDVDFNARAIVNSTVAAIGLQPDGKIVIGGTFSSVAGVNRTRIARLHKDGKLDTNFTAVIEGQMNFRKDEVIFDPDFTQGVLALLIQPDGKIVVAGAFERVNGRPRRGIARLNHDGSLDASFDVGTGANARVFAVARQRNGDVLLGGVFTRVNGIERRRLARLDVNGSVDPYFSPDLGPEWNAVTSFLTEHRELFVGGDYVGSAGYGGVARLDSGTGQVQR